MPSKIVAVILPLFLWACSPSIPDELRTQPSPDDPQSGIRRVQPANYFQGYVQRAPVPPAGWRNRTGDTPSGGSQ